MANAGGFSEERIVTPVGAGEVRKGGGDACVARYVEKDGGRRKLVEKYQNVSCIHRLKVQYFQPDLLLAGVLCRIPGWLKAEDHVNNLTNRK